MPIPIENNSWDYVQGLIEKEINSAFKLRITTEEKGIMLTAETRKKGDIISLKLSTGEEIIGYYEEEDVDSCTIDKPFSITITPEGVVTTQWLRSLDMISGEVIKISKKWIIAIFIPIEAMAKQYNSQMNSIIS